MHFLPPASDLVFFMTAAAVLLIIPGPAVLLVLLMALGSVVMWIGVPLGLIYLAAHISGSSNPSAGSGCATRARA